MSGGNIDVNDYNGNILDTFTLELNINADKNGKMSCSSNIIGNDITCVIEDDNKLQNKLTHYWGIAMSLSILVITISWSTILINCSLLLGPEGNSSDFALSFILLDNSIYYKSKLVGLYFYFQLFIIIHLSISLRSLYLQQSFSHRI